MACGFESRSAHQNNFDSHMGEIYKPSLEQSPDSANRQLSKFTGEDLLKFLELHRSDSIRVRPANLEKLLEISKIIFVGSSLVGKTTLIDTLRGAISQNEKMASTFEIPKRVTTRTSRENDNFQENQFVSKEQFEEMVADGRIKIHWTKKLGSEEEERYGFLEIEDGKMPIYSANNALVNNEESLAPSDFLRDALVVAVYSPDSLRKERMGERSPDLLRDRPEEAAARLADKAISMYPEAHLVVKNFGRYQDSAGQELVALFSGMTK